MIDSTFNTEVADSLTNLETQLETPVVPGELAGWLQETGRFLSELRPTLHSHVERRHRDEFKEIAEQDEGLLARVDQLKRDDQQILADLDRLDQVVSAMLRNSGDTESDESCAATAVDAIVDDGLELVIRIRKEEAAIGTWLIEAFERDRGVAD